MLFLWILSTFDDRIFNFFACGEHSYQYLMLYTMSLFHFDLNSIKGAKNSIFFGFSKKLSLRKLSRVKGRGTRIRNFGVGKKRGGNHFFLKILGGTYPLTHYAFWPKKLRKIAIFRNKLKDFEKTIRDESLK